MKSQISLLERFVNFVLNILIFIFGVIILILVYANFQTKILGNNYNDFLVILSLKYKQEVWRILSIQET